MSNHSVAANTITQNITTDITTNIISGHQSVPGGSHSMAANAIALNTMDILSNGATPQSFSSSNAAKNSGRPAPHHIKVSWFST